MISLIKLASAMRMAGTVIVLAIFAHPVAAQFAEQSTPARAAILYDVNSGAVLFEKDADTPIPPASMSKLMTLLVVFEGLKSGRVALEDEFRTTAKAAAMGGSKMFIREGEVVSVEDLIRGVVIQSGNDAAVALAEAMAGTEEAFAGYMTQRAADMGMKSARFANSTGWPHPDHRISVRDLAELARQLVVDYPEYYPYFAEEEFTWDDITQKNRNPLLGLGLGVDGLKTGHTEEAGYGLVASAKRGNRRVILVVSGLESTAQRRQESERLINWAFRAFETKTLYMAGEPVVYANVWIGEEAQVALAPARDVILTAPFGKIETAKFSARYPEPLPAPVEAGTEVGHILIDVDGLETVEIPLQAVETIGEGGFLSRIEAAASVVLSWVLPAEEG